MATLGNLIPLIATGHSWFGKLALSEITPLPFILSPSAVLRRALSKHMPPFDRLKTNGNSILHKAESTISVPITKDSL